MSERNELGRREFLKQSGAAALGVSALALPRRAAAAGPGVKRYATLGKTGLRVPDIAIGTGGLRDAALIRYAVERGITYIDTAEGYPMKRPGLAEKAIGQAIAGRRNEIVLASKQVAGARDKRMQMMRRLNKSLRRLRTDHIDVYFNHAVNEVERMQNPEWAEFVALAKKQGKIRFSGMSGHGGRLIECLEYSIANDLVDVVLVGYNFGQDPAFYEKFTKSFDIVANQKGLPKVLASAEKKGIGRIAMKTLMGARLNDLRQFEKPGGTFAQAAFRWVLESRNVDSLIVSMKSREMIDEYLGASGATAMRRGDAALLAEYTRLNGKTQCRPGCSECESACPLDVPIADVLRARMYAEDYAEPERGRLAYEGVAPGASPCLSCANPTCVAACPHGLDVASLTRRTARLLGSV